MTNKVPNWYCIKFVKIVFIIKKIMIKSTKRVLIKLNCLIDKVKIIMAIMAFNMGYNILSAFPFILDGKNIPIVISPNIICDFMFSIFIGIFHFLRISVYNIC